MTTQHRILIPALMPITYICFATLNCDSSSSDSGGNGNQSTGTGDTGTGGDAGGDEPGASLTSVNPTIEIVSDTNQLAPGESAMVAVRLRNVPVAVRDLFGLGSKHFSLVASSADGGAVMMASDFGDSGTEVQILWDKIDARPHPSEDPAEVCDDSDGSVVADNLCEEICCDQGNGPQLISRGNCPADAVVHLDNCVAPELIGEDAACCVELRSDVSCCEPFDVYMAEADCIADGGTVGGDACDPAVAGDTRPLDAASPDIVVGTTLFCETETPNLQVAVADHNRCACCRVPGELGALSFDSFCDIENRQPIAACLDGGCYPDYSDGVGHCTMACCELADGSHELMDRKVCEDNGGTDAGFGTFSCQVGSVCCQKGTDFSYFGRPQYIYAEAFIPVTAVANGTVIFRLRQVSTDFPVVAFDEEFGGSSSDMVTVSQMEDPMSKGTDDKPACADVAGMWRFNVDEIISSCGPETPFTNTVFIMQSGCGIGALNTIGLQGTTKMMPGDIEGNVMTIGPFDFSDDSGATTSTFTLNLTSDNTMEGSESWSFTGDSACQNGTSRVMANRLP